MVIRQRTIIYRYICPILLSSLLAVETLHGQRFGYIDSQAILDKMKEYQEANKEIDKAAEIWQKEIEQKKKELQALREQFLAEELLYTAEMKKAHLDSIKAKEDELRDFQNKRFGYEGMLFIKRQELIEPILEKVQKAVVKVAKKKKLDFIFDKASDLNMIYTNPVYNYTDFVLEELGLGDPRDTPNASKKQEENETAPSRP
ncbi:MAG: OmpH family outer membrane protein [Cytophagales bacterium]|nr:OmpH family outer membrane protein [Cytophagales bacterium]MDW8383785.1 OmpH family outer membrane protein [Flammeovirgaceae bacterium]